jgi:hypothetical protein
MYVVFVRAVLEIFALFWRYNVRGVCAGCSGNFWLHVMDV